ncbi:MAG: hypothetical protein MJ210_04505, partial [Alphaproteobacteria bacterium]|nr:hypothetical protein [Alphaproteobacteria bacterium]
MNEDNRKKMPLGEILQSSFQYCTGTPRQTLLFCIIAYILGVLSLLTWKTICFWGVLFLTYVLWGMFFRYYATRNPYFSWKALFNSLLPSTAIVVTT